LKFSFNWLSELAEGVDLPPQELARLVTMKTAECEAVESVGAYFAEVCAARIVTSEPLGERPKPKVVADTGRYGFKTLVCGAPTAAPV